MLPRQMRRRAVRASLIKVAKPLVKEAKSNLVPNRRSGRLIKSIGARSAKKGRFGAEDVEVVVSAKRTEFYDLFVEKGTIKQMGTHWMENAFQSTAGPIAVNLSREIKKRVISQVRKLQKGFSRI